MHPYLVTLCRDYIALVDAMGQPGYTQAELHALDSQRQVTHNQLIELTGKGRGEDMYRYARAVVRAAGGY